MRIAAAVSNNTVRRRRRGRRRSVRVARAPGSAGAEDPRARAQARDQDEATKAAIPTTPVVRASPQQGFRIQSAEAPMSCACAACCISTGAVFRTTSRPGPRTRGSSAACGRRSKARSTVSTISASRPISRGGRTFILDAFVAARLKPWAVVTAGKFKVPVGLERLVSATDLRFIERALPTSLVPNRDLGVQLGGDIAGGLVNYSFGYFNGVSDGGSSDGNTPTPDTENDTNGDWAARVFFQPFVNSDNFALRNLGFGVAGTFVDSTGSTGHDFVAQLSHAGPAGVLQLSRQRPPPAARLPRSTERLRMAIGCAGRRRRTTPSAASACSANTSPSRRMSRARRHCRPALGNARSHGVARAARMVRDRRGRAVPRLYSRLRLSLENKTWGAWELVARYHELDIDDATFVGGTNSFANPESAASKASAWGVGVNWYLNQNYKWSLNYDVTIVRGRCRRRRGPAGREGGVHALRAAVLKRASHDSHEVTGVTNEKVSNDSGARLRCLCSALPSRTRRR